MMIWRKKLSQSISNYDFDQASADYAELLKKLESEMKHHAL